MPAARPLRRSDLDPDPLVQFDRWYEEAAAVVDAPEAMALATADAGGAPSVRMVLMKHRDGAGVVFHTNYDGRKAAELTANPRAALLFYWAPLGRQVRVEGPVSRVSDAESDAYFRTRPRGGQVGAHASHQSRPIADRAALDRAVADAEARYAGVPVPRPSWWGGYRVQPRRWEFWQHRDDRLHDRFDYRPEGGGWVVRRLQP